MPLRRPSPPRARRPATRRPAPATVAASGWSAPAARRPPGSPGRPRRASARRPRRRRTPAAARRAPRPTARRRPGARAAPCAAPGRRAASRALRVTEPDEAHLAAQLVAGRRGDPRPDVLDDGPHVGRRAALGRLDEVGVLLRHPGRADAVAAQAEAVDEAAGRDLAGHRVDEHRAAVLTARLVLAAPPHDLGDRRLGTPRGRRRRRAAARRARPRGRRGRSRGTAGRAASGGPTTGAGTASSRSSNVGVDEARWRCPSRGRRRSCAPPRRPCRARRRPTRARSGRPPPCAAPAPAGRHHRRHARSRAPAASVTSMSPARSATLTAMPANPVSATSRFEPRPTTRTGSPDAWRAAATATQVVERPGPHEERRRATDAVRRHAGRAARRASRAARARGPPRRRRRRRSTVVTATSASRGGRGSPRAAWRCRRTPSRCTRRRDRPRRRGTTRRRRAGAATRRAPAGGRRRRR